MFPLCCVPAPFRAACVVVSVGSEGPGGQTTRPRPCPAHHTHLFPSLFVGLFSPQIETHPNASVILSNVARWGQQRGAVCPVPRSFVRWARPCFSPPTLFFSSFFMGFYTTTPCPKSTKGSIVFSLSLRLGLLCCVATPLGGCARCGTYFFSFPSISCVRVFTPPYFPTVPLGHPPPFLRPSHALGRMFAVGLISPPRFVFPLFVGSSPPPPPTPPPASKQHIRLPTEKKRERERWVQTSSVCVDEKTDSGIPLPKQEKNSVCVLVDFFLFSPVCTARRQGGTCGYTIWGGGGEGGEGEYAK